MSLLRHPRYRLLSAFLALWLVLCAVAVCVMMPSSLSGASAASSLASAGGHAGQNHCAPDDSGHRCDDRRAGEHRGLADLLPLLALIALPFFYLPRYNYFRVSPPRRRAYRPPLRLHLLNCVQLN